MNEQHRHILQMLADDKITADEAERLIDALERDRPESPPGPASRAKSRPRYLRVVMSSEGNPGEDESGRINVRIPLQLLRAGVRLTSLVPPRALTRANAELDKAGVSIDLTRLEPRDIEEVVDQLDDLTVDVDDSDTKLRVYCE